MIDTLGDDPADNMLLYRWCNVLAFFFLVGVVDLALSLPLALALALGTGHWALGTRHCALGTVHWALGTGLWALGPRLWALGSGWPLCGPPVSPTVNSATEEPSK